MIDINEVVWLHHAVWGRGGYEDKKKKKVTIEFSVCEY